MLAIGACTVVFKALGPVAFGGRQLPPRLADDGAGADREDDDPGVAHRRRPIRQAAGAATIGIPTGTKGTHTRAIAAPSAAAARPRRSWIWPASSARKSAGNAASAVCLIGLRR